MKKSMPIGRTEYRNKQVIDPNTLFTSPYDVVKHSATIHTNLKQQGVLNDDFVLAKFSEKEIEYIQEQMRSSMAAYRLFMPLDETIAKRVFNSLTNLSQVIAVLRRNTPDNDLIEIINQIPKDQIEQIEQPEMQQARRTRTQKEEEVVL